MKIPKFKPQNPKFSSGPTSKPCEWSLKKIDDTFLGRYHRSNDVKDYVKKILDRTKDILELPPTYKMYIVPGSCTGGMTSAFWSLLGPQQITSISYDYWGNLWFEELKKINLDIQFIKSSSAQPPNLKTIPKENDIVLVWTGTSNGITISELNFIDKDHEGLVIVDITSAAFIYNLPWEKIDVAVFSWQKVLGGEAQLGSVILSPKAIKRMKKIKRVIPKILDLRNYNYYINTPSILSLSDLSQCLDIYEKRGNLSYNRKICFENRKILEDWAEENNYVDFYVKIKKYRALTPLYLVFRQKFNHGALLKYLSHKKIAFDIENYKDTLPGLRIWTGPNIKKKDLIHLTNWLDWSFYKFIK